MVQHAGSKACLLDDAIHVEQRANPAQVHVERPHGPPPEHDAGVGGEVANRVEDLAHHLGLAVELLDARIDDLDRRVTYSVAESTSNSVAPGPFNGRPRMNASSTSIRGAMKRLASMSVPCAKNMSSISGAKSGSVICEAC